jgi:hypothetical protein
MVWYCTNLASIFRPHLDQARVDDGINDGRQVCDLFLAVLAVHPFHNVKVAWSVEWDGVAMEQVGHHDKVAVGRELVGDELGIDEAVADDVGNAAVTRNRVSTFWSSLGL